MLAERWLGIGSVVLAVAAAGFALRPKHHHHAHVPLAVAAVSPLRLAATHCSGKATIPPELTIDEMLHTAKAEVSRCFTGSTELQMLLTIAADGHVISASHRPEKPTDETRCIEKVLLGLHFPANHDSAMFTFSIRTKFTR